MGFESSESAVALVGMDGFRLLAATEIDGELHQLVETTADVVGCGRCGTRAASKGRRKVAVRDLPASRCQPNTVAGVTRKADHRRRGSRRPNSDSSARSAGSNLTRLTWRRSTSSWWRRTTISMSLSASDIRRTRRIWTRRTASR